MKPRVRFAPSPTGHVHIGNIRTAIFNYLFARHNGGEFLLRVEDTDRERSTKEAIDTLLECLEWLGLEYDEDIFYQSEQKDVHLAAAEKLIAEHKAYRPEPKEDEATPVLFRIPWNLDTNESVRTVGEVELALHPDATVEINHTGITFSTISKKGKAVPNAAALAGFKDLVITDSDNNVLFRLNDEIEGILNNHHTFSLTNCSKFTFTRREVFFTDLIKGELAKPLDGMKDLIIVRSDGSPVFHLGNVCDDAAQNITHIIRGDDHVENTYRHIFLFQALGFTPPKYAHMPMIVNAAGKPYSKRDGDAFVGDFREKGYLAEALFNYLSLLGWSSGDDKEKFTIAELIEAFSLERVLSSPAQFDARKLLNINALYLADMTTADFVEYAFEVCCSKQWIENLDYVYFSKVAALMHSRTKIISEIESEWGYFFVDEVTFDEKAFRKAFKKEAAVTGLQNLHSLLKECDEFDKESVAECIRSAEESAGLSSGGLNQSLRVSITGCMRGADILDTVLVLGKARVVKRIETALNKHANASE